MSEIALSTTQRVSLFELQRQDRIRREATERLSTGSQVNSIRDNPQDFARVSALTDRVNGLLDTKSDIGRGIDALSATQVGLEAVENFGRQLEGLTFAAQNTSDATERARIAEQFDRVRTQLDNLVGDTSFGGVNLIDNPADTLRVNVSDQSSGRLDIQGGAADSAGLGVGAAASTFNNFATQADIDAARQAVEDAVDSTRGLQASIQGNTAILRVRESFTEDLTAVFQQSIADIVYPNLAAEAVRALTTDVRSALATEGLAVTTNADRQIAALVADS